MMGDRWGVTDEEVARRSPPELRDLPELAPGQRFTDRWRTSDGGLLSVDPGAQLTGQIMGAAMSYVLVPVGGSRVRRPASC